MSREPLVAAPEALGFGVPRALACGSCFGIVVERRASNQLRVQGLGFSTKRIRRARHQGRGPCTTPKHDLAPELCSCPSGP